MQPSRDISRLIEIMAALRDPKSGCPWDLEQDFSSIRHHTVEEAYEVADAIERNDFDDLCDELGDLLLQPVYLAQLASEEKHFDFADVVEGITTKLIRRHPHVFGDVAAKSAGAAKGSWEKVKAEERASKASKIDTSNKGHAPSLLDDVPRPLPALNRAEKLAKRAASVGFDWPDVEHVMGKCREEMDEVSEAVQNQAPQSSVHEEIGDLLFAVTNLARKLDVDAEAALADANTKFARRFVYVEQRCREDNISLSDASLEQMDAYWNEIRQSDKDPK